MRNLRTIVLFMLTIFSISLFAQGKELKGMVYGRNPLAPIGNATIIISDNDSVVGLSESNNEGNFKIEDIPNGKLGVYVHKIGYKTLSDSIDIDSDNNYVAIMDQEPIELDSITVYGNRKPIRTPYGHIYFLSQKAAECGNPYLALQEIPKLKSDYISESLSSVDGKEILFLVDGSKINTGLKTIDPSRIASVEVIDVVSSKYIRTGAGRIVNIHLKQTKTIYTYVRIGFGNTFPWKQGWTGLTSEIGNSKLSFYFELSPSWNRYEHSRSYINTVTSDYKRDINGEDDSRSHNMDYSSMIKWRPSKKDYLIFSFQVYNNHGRDFSHDWGTHENLEDKSTKDYFSYETDGVKSHVYSQTLYYERDFSKSLSIDGTVSHTYNSNKQKSDEQQSFSGNIFETNQYFSIKRHTFSQELNLSWTINDKFSLEFGNATDYYVNKLKQLTLNSNYKFKNLNEYGYVSLAVKLSGFSTVLSAGADYMNLNSAGIKHDYTRPNISMDLSYEKGISTTSLSYRLTNSQPSISNLNPFNTSTDSLQQTSGNPMLVPERTHSLTFGEDLFFSGLNLSTEVNYEYTKDMILPYSYYKDGIHYSTFNNYGGYHNLSLKESVSFNYNNLDLGATGTYSVIDYEGQKNKKKFNLNIYAIWSWNKFGWHTDFAYMNKNYTLYSETRYHRPYSSSMAISYNLNPNLIFILGCQQIYGKPNYDKDYHVNNYSSHTKIKDIDSQVFVTIRWTLRKNSKDKINISEDKIKEHEKGIVL